MARLPRVTSKVFAENATEVGQFGSLNAGTKVTTTDIATIQGLPAWQDGWQAANLGDNCYPTLQERNGLDKVQSYFLNYLLQEGIPEWDAGTTYYTGSIVKLINGTDVQFYKSLIDNNTAVLTDTTAWEEILISGANKDLSNLSTTGINNLIQYAYKLDTANMITVSTTNSITTQVFTAPDDGMFYTRTICSGGSAGNRELINRIYEKNAAIEAYNLNSRWTNTNFSYAVIFSKPVLKGDEVNYIIYANGGTTEGIAYFIPFKK